LSCWRERGNLAARPPDAPPGKKMNSRTQTFSVIIPTRDRASVFDTALKSVLAQQYRDFEVIVVDDGSSIEQNRIYRTLTAPVGAKLLTLDAKSNGYGPSFARNYGAAHTRGDYLCFLDDDDEWIDSMHLQRVAKVIAPQPTDLILANQKAFRAGVALPDGIWIEDLANRLRQQTDANGAVEVTSRQLLTCAGHCHVNTMIVRNTFYQTLGGFDEYLRYEEDVDFFLRAIDRAERVKYLPFLVSRHNVSVVNSASTSVDTTSKQVNRVYLYRKAALLSQQPEVRRYALRHLSFALERVARDTLLQGRITVAIRYMAEWLKTKVALIGDGENKRRAI